MEQLVAVLLLWISQNTQFQYQPDMGLPAITQVTQQRLADIYLGDGESSSLGYLSEADKQQFYSNLTESLEAVYDSDKNTIYLGEHYEPDSDYGRSVLVHELVHFLQYKYKVHEQVACINKLETDAYLIQADYMKENNLVPEFNQFTVAMRSLCDHEIY